MHTPQPISVERVERAPGESQVAWWWATAVFVAITVGLWTWRAICTLSLSVPAATPQHAGLRRYVAAPSAAARVTAPAPLATPRLEDHPPGAATADAGHQHVRVTIGPVRPTAHAARSPRPDAQRTAAVAPERAPQIVDMDLMNEPSSPLELAALDQSRIRAGRSRRPRSLAPTYLQLNSRPWSQVYLDGQFVGNTPLRGRRLLPGHYRVELVNRELHMRKQFDLMLREGETITRSEQLDAE